MQQIGTTCVVKAAGASAYIIEQKQQYRNKNFNMYAHSDYNQTVMITNNVIHCIYKFCLSNGFAALIKV